MKPSRGSRHPFIGLALSAAAGILIADILPLPRTAVALAIASGAFLAFLWPSSKGTYALVAGCFFFLHSTQIRDTPGLQLAKQVGEQPRAVDATGIVVSEARIAANGLATFLLRLNTIAAEEKEQKCRATVRVRWREAVELGDQLQLFGTISPIAPPRNPGEFDVRAYLARQDVRQEIFVRYAENGVILRHTNLNPVLRAAQKTRAWMQKGICQGLENSPDVQSLVSGMALGVRHETEEDIEEPFQQTGTLHLFAVAGLHVGIVAQLLWILAMVMRLSRRWTIAIIIPALLFYAAVTGLHTSSVRAAVMSSVLLGGFFVERKVFALNSLAAAAFLILAWDTNELFAVGFQLSFSVVAAIILLADPIFRLLRQFGAPDPFLPRGLLRGPQRFIDSCAGWICRGASVSLAAWIGSLPLLFWYFYLITTISVFANLVVVPIAFFILGIGMLSLLTTPLSSWLSIIFNNANWALAKAILGVVHVFAQVPGGHYYVAHPRWPTGAETEITALDAGAGGAIHLQTDGSNWLLDCGSERDYERLLRPYLHSRGVDRLTGLVLMHGDSLHLGGALDVINDFAPSLLYDNPVPDRSSVHRKLQQEFVRQKLRTQLVTAGAEVRISPNVTAKILHPRAIVLGSKRADDQALVAQLLLGSRHRVLVVSDIGIETEKALLLNQLDLRSDILIKGQHHSGVSGSQEFLERVQPKAIIATSREFPEAERLTDEWCEMVRSLGIKLFRQDKSGAVEIRFFPDRWEASSYLTGEVFRSSSQ